MNSIRWRRLLCPGSATLAVLPLLLVALPALARDQIRVVGSSTVFPFTTTVAERFGRRIAARVADLLTLGSFGAPADRVGFESAFPALAERLSRAGGRLSALGLQRILGVRRLRPDVSRETNPAPSPDRRIT